jgi:orotidine-5'-phosphate decarboxylase
MYNPILLALDLDSEAQALDLAQSVAPYVGGFKVGKELFVTAGPQVVSKLLATGARVFLDLKFHDIPNTVAKAVASATRLGVSMMTVHTCGGRRMMEAAQEAAESTARTLGCPTPLVLGVTVLTSFEDSTLTEIGVSGSVEDQVAKLAALAHEAGLCGLVCSPLELQRLRRILPASVQLVTPGIRDANAPVDDQRRTLSPCEAIRLGANWLVVGRPIHAASNPVEASKRLFENLKV